MISSHLLHLHVQIRHLLVDEDGDALVVVSSTSKQLKASYCLRWLRFNNLMESGLSTKFAYITQRYVVRTVGTCPSPPTTVLVIQNNGVYI